MDTCLPVKIAPSLPSAQRVRGTVCGAFDNTLDFDTVRTYIIRV